MGENRREMSDLVLLVRLGHLAITSEDKREVRRRYPRGSKAYQMAFGAKEEEEDPGHFHVAQHGAVKGTWLLFQNKGWKLARETGKKWEDYKKAHPNWHEEGEE
jgi:hypothetical protein